MIEVTVIIPCGGWHSRYVNDAVQSCLQADPPPTKIIVVDDGSVPPVRLGRHPLVELLCLPTHSGRSAARNLAVELATTDWLYFLDSDDFLEPTAIADFLSIVEARPCDLAYADYDYLTATSERVRVGKAPWVFMPTDCRNLVNIGLFVKRDRFRLVGGFDEDMAIGEYWDFFLRYTANKAAKVVKHNRPFFVARQSSSVNPKAQPLMEQASLKIAAMIRGQYYHRWKNL